MVESPVNSAPLQSFVDAGDERTGATVLSEGLMEYEVLPGSGDGPQIALTLLRSVGFLSRGDLATAERYGRRVAEITAQFVRGRLA